MDDLGKILDIMRKREETGCKSALRLHLLQGRSAMVVRKAAKTEWKNILHESVGLKKSTWYDRVATYSEFGPLILTKDEEPDVDPEYASIPCTSLKLLLKVAKGVDDAAKEEWLTEAAALSFTDLKKKIDEITGKEKCPCDALQPIEIKAWECTACGKVHKKELSGDA